jgi:hypothetical protein
MTDETNTCQLNLTAREFKLLEIVYAIGAIKVLEALGPVRAPEGTLNSFITKYRKMVREDDNLLPVINGKLVAVRTLAEVEERHNHDISPALPAVVRHDLSEPEAILLMNMISLASALLVQEADAATAIFMHLKDLALDEPDTYSKMLVRITRTTAAALPGTDFVSL